MLTQSGADGPDARARARAREEAHGLGLFVRSLVGMDRQAALDAFSEFLANSRFSVTEIRFIQLIVDELTANGVVEARRLYEPPFTDHAPTGPDHIFGEANVDRIIDILHRVRGDARPDTGVA